MPGDSPRGPHIFTLAGEDKGHFKVVTSLTDRTLCEHVDWIEDQVLRDYRTWKGPDQHRPYWPLKEAFKKARSERLPVHGHFDGQPGALDARMFRAQLLLWAKEQPQPDVAFIARDLDGEPNRRTGFCQARKAGRWPFKIVFAAPDPEIEAWILCGFRPESEVERRRLESVGEELDFDPTRQPARLTSRRKTDLRDAKRVCLFLTDGDEARYARCLQAPFSTLREHGDSCGMVAFLDAVQSEVLPYFKPPNGSNAS